MFFSLSLPSTSKNAKKNLKEQFNYFFHSLPNFILIFVICSLPTSLIFFNTFSQQRSSSFMVKEIFTFTSCAAAGVKGGKKNKPKRETRNKYHIYV
jgi:uncharacterized membrane protein YadS